MFMLLHRIRDHFYEIFINIIPQQWSACRTLAVPSDVTSISLELLEGAFLRMIKIF